ncbi:hypothetical protein SSKA14_4161 [Stenotrophomonas sp. SKA14]|uniref:hypothetical protein n=1 Tax=Stenotrophomonas TaxID=40323 RepID=UPI00018FE984|nr:hypothetical protein [Stenotrophomonas sp. SKA14]EED41137.1 hypothetical protein SSKA14_4161 [Stenotrophomonas sp. SKA14]
MFSVWRAFGKISRPLQPHQVEGAIAPLQLDEFDANELRLRAAREAGWNIDPKMLLEGGA